jgi:hypothetical protein
MVVFVGASSRLAGGSSDLWWLSLDDYTWTSSTLTGPPAMRGHAAIFDETGERMIVFGGSATASGSEQSQVWALSLAGTPAWSEVLPSGSPPSGRRGHTAVYDPVRDRMIVFGGNAGSTLLNDVWALSLNGSPAWTQLADVGTPPDGRTGHTAVYDGSRDRMVVYGGRTPDGASSEAWALSLGEAPAWTLLAPGAAPPNRFEHTAIYDPTRFRMVTFGGWEGEYVLRNDAWILTWGPPHLAVIPTGGGLLLGARPNPFRAGGNILFDLPRESEVALEVFDVRGRRVETLTR